MLFSAGCQELIEGIDARFQPIKISGPGKDLSGAFEGAGGIGGLLARTDDRVGTTAFYHSDRLGNVTMLINAQQVPVAKYLYDPFGNTLSASGPLADANLYRFSGKEVHPNSGLSYYLYRFYSPNLQRWINRDPGIEASLFITRAGFWAFGVDKSLAEAEKFNVYGFVNNQASFEIDPDGRIAIVPILIGTGVAVVIAIACEAGMMRQQSRAKRDLPNNTCATWTPKCLNAIAVITGAPVPISIQFCKDCNGQFSTSPIYPGILVGNE